MSTKPTASLTAAEVHEIVTDLDNLILEARRNEDNKEYSHSKQCVEAGKQIAYMKIRNLILSKL